jgi:putative zinc finger/helix-turn-helix YgiT family protein
MEDLRNNCPLGHGEMQEGTATKEIVVRGEKVSYQLDCLICPVCALTRATVEQTAKAQFAIVDTYRKKTGLLTGQEIKQYREKLGLSQQQLADKAQCSKMSIIRWENGVIQKPASDKAIRDILCPAGIEDEFTGNRALSLGRIKLVYEEFKKYVKYELLIPGDRGLFAAKNCWYADLIAYRELGQGMTGASYAVMPYGPQLDNYADLVNEILKVDTAAVQPLSPEEVEIIRRLSEIFKEQRDAYDASHAEPEWKKIEKNFGRRISYRIAFKLTGTA